MKIFSQATGLLLRNHFIVKRRQNKHQHGNLLQNMLVNGEKESKRGMLVYSSSSSVSLFAPIYGVLGRIKIPTTTIHPRSDYSRRNTLCEGMSLQRRRWCSRIGLKLGAALGKVNLLLETMAGRTTIFLLLRRANGSNTEW